jgi:hypothetical protein
MYHTTVINGQYVTILSRFVGFDDVLHAIKESYPNPQALIWLSSMSLNDNEYAELSDMGIAAIVVE